MNLDQALLDDVITLAVQAGVKILSIYNSTTGFTVKNKQDDTPVTEADLCANACIVEGLSALTPHIPVLTEELPLPAFSERRQWGRYWLVDPLDGTKEFISRNGEFTVNIALIEQGQPLLGVVYVPVTGVIYAGLKGRGAYKVSQNKMETLSVRAVESEIDSQIDNQVDSQNVQRRPIDILVSRHYAGDFVEDVCRRIKAQWGAVNTVSVGSSLKFCLIAAGQADLYPRFGLTSEWDTAAAQAIVESAGGHVVDSCWQPLNYNQKESILNPPFYVFGDDIVKWKTILESALK